MVGLIRLFFLNFGGLRTVNERGKIASAKKKKSTAYIWRDEKHVLGKERKSNLNNICLFNSILEKAERQYLHGKEFSGYYRETQLLHVPKLGTMRWIKLIKKFKSAVHYELVNFKVLKIERNTTLRYVECLIYHLEQLRSWSNSQPNFANIYGH